MATSSSDESCTAPKDFHLSSSLDSGSRLSPNRQRCPLCSSFKKVFYCRECINRGDFYASASYPERYAEKLVKLQQLKEIRKNIEDDCCPLMERKQKMDTLHYKIRQYKDRIKIFKLAVEEKKKAQTANKHKLVTLRSKNEKLTTSLPNYKKQVQKLEEYVTNKQDEIDKSKDKLGQIQEDSKHYTKIRIQQLMQYIFPISRIQPRSTNVSSDSELSENDMVSAEIAEAAHTTYVRDRWVYTDNSGELKYSIVAPALPGSGNYSAYNVWVAQNKEHDHGSSSSTSVKHNPAYSTIAALTYTAQLINVIAYYLDIRLPYKMIYSDFCSSNYMSEQQFTRRVARLNANILHLCFSQNVDLSNLHPAQTLHNILQLLDTEISDLGRHGPVEVDAQMALSLEEQLCEDLQAGEDSDSESGDVLTQGWEAVPLVHIPEGAPGPTNLQSTQTINQQGQMNSITSGLYTSAANSIASIWRGWTGR